MLSDGDLMARIRDGDEGAFDELFSRFEGLVRSRVRSVVGSASAADDVTQEVFLRLWTRAEQWEGRGSVNGWLMRMATNLALNHLRTVRRRRQQPLESTVRKNPEGEEMDAMWLADTSTPSPHEQVERAERSDTLRQLVDELKPRHREPLRLVHEQDLDLAEVSDRLGVPLGTVKSRLYYAREQLLKRWMELQDE